MAATHWHNASPMSRWRPPSPASTALITREGFERLRDELNLLWKTRREGSAQSLVVSTSQSEALDAGRRAAVRDRVDHLSRDMDGRLLCQNSYRDLPKSY